MQDFTNKKIVFGISGGIAAYKSAYLVRELTRLGASIRVVMTQSAQEFITPMTFQALTGQEVRCELLDTQAERAMGHIELARWADYLLIAPATANCIAKMAHGLADDLLSTLFLVAETPVIVCPAMNRSMWLNPATQANCRLLIERGVTFVGPEVGSQACGEYGLGRLSEVDHIIHALRLIDMKPWLFKQKVLITAGPTQEAIDPVRYITNRSSGKMGYALAQAAQMAGAQVTLISGPTALPAPLGVDIHYVNTARLMLDKVMRHLEPGMLFIGSAAIADFYVDSIATEKIKKNNDAAMTLKLVPNPDILKAVVESNRASYIVGFAAETHQVEHYAQEKLRNKKLDMIIANQVGENIGFDQDENQVTILTTQQQIELPLMHKTRLAGQIIAILAANLQNVGQQE
jgi:phosphopantothenoylcysteine decarboxylase/phosphopantothenate--cysteine ligase